MYAVKYALLALLQEQSRHGYDLKHAFEELLGGAWPLNIGQVYSTLARLERDGLVRSRVVPQDLVPDRKVYELTDDGRTELASWLSAPVDGPVRLKNDLFVKVVLRGIVNGQDTGLLVKQRQAYMRRLAELRELLTQDGLDERMRLVVEGAMLHVEADLRWLDLYEERMGAMRR